jgi:integrase
MGKKNFSGVRKEIRGGKPRWIIDFRFTDSNGQRQRFRRDASVQSQAAAVAEAKRLLAMAASTGSVAEPEANAPPKLTVSGFLHGDYERLFLRRLRPQTQVNYWRYLALIERLVGRKALEEISAKDDLEIDAALPTLRTRELGRAVLRTFLRSAVTAGHLSAVPKLAPMPKAPKRELAVPTESDAERVLARLEGWAKLAFALAIDAGLRSGEFRALRVCDVELDDGHIVVRRSFSAGIEQPTTKGNADRKIPLTPRLATWLREAMAGKAPDALLISARGGKRIASTSLGMTLLRVAATYGLPYFSAHKWRHYFATKVLEVSGSLKATQLLLGHSSPQVTERYAHAQVGVVRAAMAKFSARAAGAEHQAAGQKAGNDRVEFGKAYETRLSATGVDAVESHTPRRHRRARGAARLCA